jgi:hypothetical protein
MAATADLILTSEAEIYLDTAVSNKARIFDYLLGGTANFEADREAAEKMLLLAPALRKWVRLHRAFSQEAAYKLYQDGFRQYLDLGSGMPTENQLHVTIPQARIVYSDTNPVAVSYGQSLFAEFVNIDYVYGGFNQIDQLLSDPALRRLIDRRDKVAIGLNTLPFTLSNKQFRQLSQTLYEWAPPNSQIFLIMQTQTEPTRIKLYEKLLSVSQKAHCPMYIRPLEQMLALIQPWRILDRQPLAQFLGLPADLLTNDDPATIGAAFFAVFLTKEQALQG